MAETLVIGGTSHTGKSTLAEQCAATSGGCAVSTDSLARHPGRPWPDVKPHVAEFYRQLSADAIFQFLLIHHANMWPGIRSMITRQHASATDPLLILEGCALRPEFIAELGIPLRASAWLFARDEFLAERMFAASGHAQATREQQILVEAFVRRSLHDNAEIISNARRLGLRLLDVESPDEVAEFHTQCGDSRAD